MKTNHPNSPDPEKLNDSADHPSKKSSYSGVSNGLQSNDDTFIPADEVCALVGGRQRPISKATLYRHIKAGRFPPPEHPTPGISRWRYSRIREALDHGRVGAHVGKQIPPRIYNEAVP